MGTVLITWELGSGMGHLASIRPLAAGLLDRGHSPIALLAARTTPMKTATLGTGFYCPAPGSPLPDWRPEAKAIPQRLIADENRLLETMNRLLEK